MRGEVIFFSGVTTTKFSRKQSPPHAHTSLEQQYQQEKEGYEKVMIKEVND